MKKRLLSFLLAVLMVVGMVPVVAVSAVEPAAQGETGTLTYEDLYVKGATIMLDAFDPSNVDLANGKWTSTDGKTVATIKGGVYGDSNKTGWVAGKGISWQQIHSVSGTGIRENGIYFDIADLPTGDFTVENVIIWAGITNADGSGWDGVYTDGSDASKALYSGSSTAGRYGVYAEDSFVYGPIRNVSFIAKSHTTYLNGVAQQTTDCYSSRWYYTGMRYGNHNTSLGNYGVAISNPGQEMGVGNFAPSKAFTFATTYDLVGGNTYDTASSAIITNLYDAQAGRQVTVTAGQISGVDAYKNTLLPTTAGYDKTGAAVASNARFNVMKGVAGTIFSIRVYDKVLSKAEMDQNHFADMVAYLNFDLTEFAKLSNSGRQYVYSQLSSVAINEATVADVNAVIARAAAEQPVMTDYDKLYIQDGLVMLLSAFDAKSAGLSKDENGMLIAWSNKVGDNMVSFYNYTDSADASNNIWWKLRDGKGLGYDLSQAGFGVDANAKGIKSYLYLGDAIVDVAADYTVEYSGVVMRISANGVQTNNGNGSNTHNTQSHNNKFGAWGDWIFSMTNANDAIRVTYNTRGVNDHWGHTMITDCNLKVWVNNGNTPKTIANVMTIAEDLSTAARNTYDNGVLSATQKVPCSGVSAVITSATAFWMMQNCGNTLYAVRVYDRALTEAEAKYNAAIDKLALNDVDVSALVEYDMSMILKTSIADAAAATDAAAMQAIVDAAVAKCEKLVNAGRYEDLYVQEGLNLLLLAYGDYVKNVDLANGTWAGLKDGNNGTIVDTSSTISWTANSVANGGGITYKYPTMGDHDSNKGKLGITLPVSALGDGDATVEAVFVPHYVGTDTVIPHSNNTGGTYGKYDGGHANFTLGTIQFAFFQPSIFNNGTTEAPNWTGSSAGFRLYANNGGGHEAQGDVKSISYDTKNFLGGYKVVTDGTHNLTVSDKASAKDATVIEKTVLDTLYRGVTSMSLIRDVKGDNSYSATVVMNGDSWTKNFESKYYTTMDNCKYPADMFYSFAATVYAIRAYDHALNDIELTQNRVVDILAMNNIDVSELFAITKAQREIVYNACAGLTYTSTEAEVQAAYDAGLAKCTFTPEFTENAYLGLYVQDGLTAFYTVMDGGKTVDVENGIWYNLLDNGDTWANLVGGKWTAMNNGVGYAMNTVEWDADAKGSNYLSLGNLANNDFTVELVQTLTGLTNADGSRETVEWKEGMNHKWGYYATQYSSYEFGNFKGTSFVCYVSTAGSGNLCTRVSFNPGHWGTDNGKYWLSEFAWKDAKYATVPVTLTFTQEGGIFDREVPVLNGANSKTAIDGVTYKETGVKGYDLLVYENGKTVSESNTVTSKYSGNGQYNREIAYTDASGAEQKGYIEYLSAAEAGVPVAGAPIYVMRNMPGVVYSARVYDRALTAEEAAQNHFADLATYVALDLEAFNTLSDDSKQRVYDACVAVTFDTVTAEMLTTVINAQAYVPDSIVVDGIELDVNIGNGADDLTYAVNFLANAVKIQALWDLGFNVTITGIATDENGKTYTQVLYDTSAANANSFVPDEYGMVAAAFDVAYTTAGLEGDITVKVVLEAVAKSGITAEWVLDGGSVNFYDVAYYLVNEYEGTAVEMHKYNTNELLVSIIGEENVERQIELDIVAGGAVNDSNIPEDEKLPQGSAGSQLAIEGENSASGSLEDKVALKDDATLTYEFTTDEDGMVYLLVEYVAKDHVLKDRGLEITVDGYETIADSLNDNYMGVDTNLRDHGYLVLVFTLGAGEHTITFATPDGMLPVEIYSVAVVDTL